MIKMMRGIEGMNTQRGMIGFRMSMKSMTMIIAMLVWIDDDEMIGGYRGVGREEGKGYQE